jgi:phosphoglycerate kinase
MQAELENLTVLLEAPKTPYAAVLGGAKVSDKLDLIENLLPRVTRILIGGAMAYTFLKAKGVEVGDSRVESDRVETARKLMDDAARRGVPILLPIDHRIRASEEPQAAPRVTPDAAIPPGSKGLDIGPATIREFTAALRDARTVLWNGPMGLFEVGASGAHSVVGGGDSASAVRRFGLERRFTHVSTGGGATLEYLSGLALPGVEALTDAP